MKKRGKHSKETWKPLVWTGWVLSLLTLFWMGHPLSEIAPSASASLERMTFFLFTDEFRTSAGGLVIGVLIAIGWWGLGGQLFRLLPAPQSWKERHGVRAALGLAVTCSLWFWLGIAGLYTIWMAWLFTAIGLISAFLLYRRDRRCAPISDPWEDPVDNRFWWWIPGTIAATLFLTALPAALAPVTAKDSLLYHLSLPAAFARAGALIEIPENLMSYPPLEVEMQFVWALLAGGSEAAGMGQRAASFLGVAMFAVCFLWSVEWARSLGLNRFWSWTAALAFASIPTAWAVATSAYVDLAVALFVGIAIEATASWYETLDNRLLWPAGIFLATALCAKFTVLFLVLPFLLVILWRLRKMEEHSVQAATVRCVFLILPVAVLIAAPWYVRNWWLSGSPVFPFFLNLWPAEVAGWDVERSLLYNQWMLQYGEQPRTLLSLAAAPFRLSLWGKIESYSYYDGILGVFFLSGLPLLWLARRRFPSSLQVSLFLSAALIAAWVASSHQLRYLLPALPPLAMAIAFAAATSGRWAASDDDSSAWAAIFRAALLAPMAVNLVVIILLYRSLSPLPVVLGTESTENYLSRRLPYYSLYQEANTKLSGNAKIWLINLRNDTYYLQRPAFTDDFFEDWTLTQMVYKAETLPEMIESVKALGVTHLMVRYPLLFDQRYSPLVDPKDPQGSRKNLDLLERFLFRYCRVLEKSPHYLFAEFPAALQASR